MLIKYSLPINRYSLDYIHMVLSKTNRYCFNHYSATECIYLLYRYFKINKAYL